MENIFEVHLVDVAFLLQGIAFTACTLSVNFVHFRGITRATRLHPSSLAAALGHSIEIGLVSSEAEAYFHILVVLFSHGEAVGIISGHLKPWMLEHLRDGNSIFRNDLQHVRY